MLSSAATAFSSADQRCLAPSSLQADQYGLVRLSEFEHEDVLRFFDTQERTLKVPSVVPLSDGSYEIELEIEGFWNFGVCLHVEVY